MLSQKKFSLPDDLTQQVNEPQAGFEKAELELLKVGILSSYTQRFETMMNLIKLGIMLKNAKIVHQKSSAK